MTGPWGLRKVVGLGTTTGAGKKKFALFLGVGAFGGAMGDLRSFNPQQGWDCWEANEGLCDAGVGLHT